MNSIDKLIQMLEYDPAKPNKLATNVVQSALDEIKAEATVKAKEKVKESLKKAVDLRLKMDQARKNFDKEFGRFDKELGAIVNRLFAAANGQPAEEVDDSAGKDAGSGGEGKSETMATDGSN